MPAVIEGYQTKRQQKANQEVDEAERDKNDSFEPVSHTESEASVS